MFEVILKYDMQFLPMNVPSTQIQNVFLSFNYKQKPEVAVISGHVTVVRDVFWHQQNCTFQSFKKNPVSLCPPMNTLLIGTHIV